MTEAMKNVEPFILETPGDLNTAVLHPMTLDTIDECLTHFESTPILRSIWLAESMYSEECANFALDMFGEDKAAIIHDSLIGNLDEETATAFTKQYRETIASRLQSANKA